MIIIIRDEKQRKKWSFESFPESYPPIPDPVVPNFNKIWKLFLPGIQLAPNWHISDWQSSDITFPIIGI